MRIAGSAIVLAISCPLFAQDKPPAVDSVKVAKAIDRGAAWLIARQKNQGADYTDELVLWTLLHAGVTAKEPAFKTLLDRMLETPLGRTYNVAIQAMILEELNRVAFQPRIAACAQFLVDGQLADGSWTYEGPANPPDVPTGRGDPRPPVPTGPGGGKPRVVRKIAVKRKAPWKVQEGDGSNTQYAALGLRACHDAGIVLPKETIERGRKYWIDAQEDPPERRNPYGDPRGWSYNPKATTYGSMTAGGLGSVVIYDYIAGQDWRKNPAALDGLAWLACNFTVTENPKHGGSDDQGRSQWHYYYLYGLERAATLYGTERLGKHFWYAEGARYLLEKQAPQGSWNGDPVDTCFAILFLKRATRPFVDVETPSGRKPPARRPDGPRERE